MRHRLWSRLAAATVVVGLITVVVGVFMATVWAPATTFSTTVPVKDASLVVTAPGFLELNGANVTVTSHAASPEQRVFLGVARAGDADSYLAESARRTLLGLTGVGNAITADAPGSGDAPPPGRVDIWREKVAGAGGAELTWTGRPGAWVLIATAADGKGPAGGDLTFTWLLPHQRSAAPAVIALGVLLVVSGAIGLALLLAPARMELIQPEPEPEGSQTAGQSWMERTR